jgi:hypothetical protein
MIISIYFDSDYFDDYDKSDDNDDCE